MNKIMFSAAMIVTMFAISGPFFVGGCTEEQIEQVDRVVTDANDIVAGVKALLESPPARAFLPPDIQLYGAVGIAVASMVVNGWQQVKGSLMKKTTKAIVRGIEVAEKVEKPNPTNKIKESIKTEMELAGIFDRGNTLVDQLKVAR